MRTEGIRVLIVRAAYALAMIAAVAWAYLLLSVSANNGTLGYDFKAYDLAVDHLLAGQSMYDQTATSMGAFGLFFYPPPFAVLILPLGLVPTDIGLWIWTLGLIAASVAAVVLMPVSPRTRFIVLLLAAFSWPLVYAIKLGQVGSVLLLLFAIGWRWLDRPWPFGVAAGLGPVIKLQPGLVIGWAMVTGRRRAAAIAIGIFAVLGLIATVVAGPQSWGDWLAVLGRVGRPVLAENDTGFGRLAYLGGASLELATAIHYVNVGLVIVVTTFALVRAVPVATYLAVVVASQFVSPVLWDHYALILLLPVAWLIDRGRIWAALIPLVTATVLAGATPTIAYPVLFWVTLLGVTWEGIAMRRGRTLRAQGNAATSILGA
jgi:alpha-1,2-mannosyltransferase